MNFLYYHDTSFFQIQMAWLGSQVAGEQIMKSNYDEA